MTTLTGRPPISFTTTLYDADIPYDSDIRYDGLIITNTSWTGRPQAGVFTSYTWDNAPDTWISVTANWDNYGTLQPTTWTGRTIPA